MRLLIRSAAEAKIREADKLECDAWNAIMWAGVPAMPSGEPHPTIAKALNAGYDLIEAKCNRCRRVSRLPLLTLKYPPETPVWNWSRCCFSSRAARLRFSETIF